MNDALICPSRGHYDQMQKVSSIVKSETRTREGTDWITETYTDNKGREQSFSYPRSYDIVEITDLARRLSPPAKPQAQRASGGLTVIAWLIVGSCLILYALYWLYLTLRGEMWSLVIFFAAFVVVLVIATVRIVSRYQKSLAQARRSLEQLRVEIPRWENAIDRWHQAYYCRQDDIVFIPNEKWVPLAQLEELLYKSEMP